MQLTPEYIISNIKQGHYGDEKSWKTIDNPHASAKLLAQVNDNFGDEFRKPHCILWIKLSTFNFVFDATVSEQFNQVERRFELMTVVIDKQDIAMTENQFSQNLHEELRKLLSHILEINNEKVSQFECVWLDPNEYDMQRWLDDSIGDRLTRLVHYWSKPHVPAFYSLSFLLRTEKGWTQNQFQNVVTSFWNDFNQFGIIHEEFIMNYEDDIRMVRKSLENIFHTTTPQFLCSRNVLVEHADFQLEQSEGRLLLIEEHEEKMSNESIHHNSLQSTINIAIKENKLVLSSLTNSRLSTCLISLRPALHTTSCC